MNYAAVIQWLTAAYQPKNDFNLEKVRPLLESFYPLYEVEDWVRVSEIMAVEFNTPTQEELHGQLRLWGYYREAGDLYTRLIGKLG